MKRVVVAFILLAAWAASVHACGDKFLVLGRTVRQNQITPANLKARVLIFQQAANPSRTAIQGTLKGFGHQVDTAADTQQLTDALKANKYDIVVTDYSQAADVAGKVEAAASDATVLPLVEETNEADLKAAKSQYSAVLKVPTKPTKLLSTVTETLEKRNSLATK